MKTSKKALAFALAAAMVVTAVPVTNAEAASTAKLSATKATLYTGQSKTITLKTPSSWKSVKTPVVKTGKKSVATVKKVSTKKYTVKAVKAGTTKVYVKVTAKKNGKTVKKTLTSTITVKNPSITINGDAELLINATKNYKATVKPSTTVTYTSSDESIATVDAKGDVKGIKAGKVTITATAKVGTKTVKATKDITVKNGITEFKAATPKKLTVKFAGAVEATKDAFALTDAKGTKAALKSVTFDETKQIATVEVYSELTSGTEYTVNAKIGEETFTSKLSFVKGEVAKITGVDQTVKAADANAKISYTVSDENGLDITDSTNVSFESNVPVNSDGTINIANGVIAYVTVVYTNPKTGAQIKSNQFTVKGSDSAAASINAITIDDAGKTIVADKFPTNVVTTVAKGVTNKAVYALTADQFGKKSVNDNLTFESLDPSVLVVDAKSGAITTISEGVGQVKVSSGSVSNAFTITVTAAAKETSLALDTASNAKAMVGGKVANNTAITVNVLDQSGNKKNDVAYLTYELTSGDEIVSYNGTVLTTKDASKKTFTVKAGTSVALAGEKAGTAYFKVTSDKTGNTYIMVPVTVYANDTNIVKYAFDGVKDFDIEKTYLKENDPNRQKPTTVSVYGVNANGFKVSKVESDEKNTLTIEAKKGTDVVASTSNKENPWDCTIKAYKDKFESEGEYSLTATQNGTVIATATFKITDSGVKPVVTVKKNELTSAEAYDITKQFSADKGNVTGIKFVSGNKAVLGSATDAVSTVSVTDNVTIYNVVAIVTLDNGRTYEVATNQSIKITK